MQTLNVGAGRTDSEYKAAEEQRRADLRDDSRSDANYFFWAAGLAALGTDLLSVRLTFWAFLARHAVNFILSRCTARLRRGTSPPLPQRPRKNVAPRD